MTDIITLIANLALTLSFIVALIFGIAQVRAAARDRRERLTLDVLRNFQSREFAELINFVASHKVPSSWEEMRALPDDEQVRFIQFSQTMESLGMMVAEKYIDMNLVDKTLGSFVTTSFERNRKLIMDIRKRNNDPFMSEYFQWLAERIEKRMRDYPRKPFHE